LKLDVYKGLTTKQQSILKSIRLTPAKYTVINASRQAGKSVLLSHTAVLLSFEKKNLLGGCITPSHTQSRNLYKKIISKVPAQLILSKTNSDADRKIVFINNSTLQFLSSKYANNIRSFSFDFLILDEFSYINESAYNEAISPTIAAKKQAKVIAASTPCGYNLFEKWCANGMDEKNNRYNYHYFHYLDNPYYDIEEINFKKKELPLQIFQQEYEARFIKGSSTVFGDFSKHQVINEFKLYNPLVQYYFGIDWSGSGTDDTVLYIIDNFGRTVLIEEFHQDLLIDKAKAISKKINQYKAIGYSETNGLGQGATEIVQENTEHTHRFIMTNESKQELVKELLLELNNDNIKLPTLDLCPKLDNQMSTFQVSRTSTGKLKYSHINNMHDDYVDALLIANYARINLTNNTIDVYSPDEYDYNNYSDDFQY